MTSSMRDEIWASKGMGGRRKQAGLIPLTIFWIVWKERNQKAFDGVDDVDGFDLLNN